MMLPLCAQCGRATPIPIYFDGQRVFCRACWLRLVPLDEFIERELHPLWRHGEQEAQESVEDAPLEDAD